MTLQIKKDESQSSAAETDGRNDTYDVRKKKKKKKSGAQTDRADAWLRFKCHQKLEGRDLSLFFLCVCV